MLVRCPCLWKPSAVLRCNLMLCAPITPCRVHDVCRLIANKFLRKKLHSHQVEQHVEWLYAFDVHCNSYFPLFLVLYGGSQWAV